MNYSLDMDGVMQPSNHKGQHLKPVLAVIRTHKGKKPVSSLSGKFIKPGNSGFLGRNKHSSLQFYPKLLPNTKYTK